MPLAIPWLLGALGLGVTGGVILSDGMKNTLQLAVVGGIIFYVFKNKG